MVNSIADIAEELMSKYSSSKDKIKGKKKDIFNSILENLFYKYGEFFGYSDIHAFKSVVVRAKNAHRKHKNNISSKVKPSLEKHPESKFWEDYVNLKSFFHPREGDGAIFTEYQIEALGLNPDSYY